VDLHLSAFSSYCNWRAGRRLPWQAHFNRTAPRELGMHAASLTPDLHFDCVVDALSLPLELAQQPWRADERCNTLAAPLLAEGADPQALRRGWLAGVHEAMLAQLEAGSASQEDLARPDGRQPGDAEAPVRPARQPLGRPSSTPCAGAWPPRCCASRAGTRRASRACWASSIRRTSAARCGAGPGSFRACSP
jgi:hypothetical protein